MLHEVRGLWRRFVRTSFAEERGAGTGATVSKYMGPARMMKSGIGCCAYRLGRLTVGAVVAVNAMGVCTTAIR